MDFNSEEMKKFLENLKPMPLSEYDGMMFPTFFSFSKNGAEKAVKEVIDFQSRESDILICSYPKSGTHWIYEVIYMIQRGKIELDKDAKTQTMLEAIPDLSVLDQLTSPRILDTHFSFQHIPKKHIKNRGKIVHIVRNPKDVCVSLYYHAKKDPFLCSYLNEPWEKYFEKWMSGKLPYGSWYDYELGMEAAGKNVTGIIYTCYYEEMKKSPVKEIKKLADFLDVRCSEETIQKIAEATSFENMQKNKFDSTKLISGEGFIYRKGKIGDWKNHFTVAQNERFEAQYKERMVKSHYKLDFE